MSNSLKNMLLNGNEAFAYGAINAGLELFAGYPITPSTDVMEILSSELEKYGGKFIIAESELAAINILMGAGATNAKTITATSGPGFSLMQEGISYMAADYIPAVILNVSREGAGLGDIPRSQGDYNQMVKGGGNGDYHSIVLACNSIKSCYEMPNLAFSLSLKYRNPIIVTYDSDIAHIRENILLPESFEKVIHIDADWSLLSTIEKNKRKKIQNKYYHNDAYNNELLEKYKIIEKNEQRYECFAMSDADTVFVAYGICSRVCREAVNIARSKGKKVGLINLISLYPFPKNAFRELCDIKKVVVVELTVMEQMTCDVRTVVNEFYGNKIDIIKVGNMSIVPTVDELLYEV